MRAAAFAIPGDLATLTGGYIYERRLLEGLRAAGREVAHLQLGASFPDPTPGDMAEALARLSEIAADVPVILDGFLVGALDPEGLAHVRAPLVAMVHHPLALESGLSPERREYLYRTERANLARCAHVLVPSPHTAAILTGDYGVPPARITVARPGTDRPEGTAQPADPPLILSVGIQHPRKGHDVLLSALAGIADLDWQAMIVGGIHDDAHAADLQRMRHALGLSARVRLAGRIPQAELDAAYRAASLFVLATRYEGYGIVFDEALARGLPIVTCRTGAVPDTVPAEAGLLVPPEAPDALAAALRRVLTDVSLRAGMARAAARAGAALPGWDETARIAGTVLDRVAR